MKGESLEANAQSAIVNGIDMETLGGTVRAIEEEPELGKYRFRARSIWTGGTESRRGSDFGDILTAVGRPSL